MRYYNNKKQSKENYMLSCESMICSKLPELKGRFESRGIWNSLEYFYNIGKSTDEASQGIINRIEEESK
jgi:hypothetical protein